MDEEVWVPTVFSKNRDRLLAGEVAEAFFDEVLAEAKDLDLLSAEHFTVDGTLIEAWAGLKSFQRKDGSGPGPSDTDRGNPTMDFHAETRGNQTHASTTDGDARLARKGEGKEAKLCYGAHVLMENRNGLVVNTRVAATEPTSKRREMLDEFVRGLDVDCRRSFGRAHDVLTRFDHLWKRYGPGIRDIDIALRIDSYTLAAREAMSEKLANVATSPQVFHHLRRCRSCK
jgi:hypothetical protein